MMETVLFYLGILCGIFQAAAAGAELMQRVVDYLDRGLAECQIELKLAHDDAQD